MQLYFQKQIINAEQERSLPLLLPPSMGDKDAVDVSQAAEAEVDVTVDAETHILVTVDEEVAVDEAAEEVVVAEVVELVVVVPLSMVSIFQTPTEFSLPMNGNDCHTLCEIISEIKRGQRGQATPVEINTEQIKEK